MCLYETKVPSYKKIDVPPSHIDSVEAIPKHLAEVFVAFERFSGVSVSRFIRFGNGQDRVLIRLWKDQLLLYVQQHLVFSNGLFIYNFFAIIVFFWLWGRW